MSKTDYDSITKTMIFALADIKAAIDSFDRGESNAFDTLDVICMAVEAHQAAIRADSQREQARQDAA